MTDFQNGDRLEVIEKCCSVLEVGDRGVYRNQQYHPDVNTKRPHTCHPAYRRFFKKIEEAPDLLILDDPIKTETVGLMQSQAEAHAAELLSLQRRLNDALLATEKAVAAHKRDIKKISDVFTEAADANDLCDQYEDCVSELNDDLTYKLESRATEYEVTFTFQQTITVTANNEDDALDKARDDYDYGSELDSFNETDCNIEEA